MENSNSDIDNLLDIINERFNQENPPKCNIPYEIEDYVVFFWECGGIALKGSLMQTFDEDDSYYFLSEWHQGICMSSSWLPRFVKCLTIADEYLKKNGTPYYYSGTKTICGYELNKKNNTNEIN